MQMEMDEQLVWAAQYRLLDARDIRMGADPSLPASMSLYKDILSVSAIRRTTREYVKSDTAEDGVQIGLQSEGTPTPGSAVESDKAEESDEDYEKYEKRLEEAIRIFEVAPPRFLGEHSA
jgi:hypothetical protein